MSHLNVFPWYTHEPLGECLVCVYQENTSDKVDIPWYTMRVLHNYFIPHHRKYSGQHNQCCIHAAHDRKVGCNTVKYPMAFL